MSKKIYVSVPMSLGDESSSIVPCATSFNMRCTSLCTVITTISVNSDEHVSEKLCRQGMPSISASDISHLCNLATKEHLSWIHFGNEDEHVLECSKHGTGTQGYPSAGFQPQGNFNPVYST
jgi:hypothetical protein